MPISADRVTFDEDQMWVVLSDGRTLGIPLACFPRLLAAALAEREAVTIGAYNFGRRLKTLKSLTRYEFICKQWTIEPEGFTKNPIHQMPGLNT